MNKKNDIMVVKTKFFKIIFFVPSVLWLVFITIANIVKMDGEALLWSELIFLNDIILLFWFVISYIISFITIKIRKKSHNNETITDNHKKKVIENVVSEVKKEESLKAKLEKQKSQKCLYSCNSIIDVNEFKKMTKCFPKLFCWNFIISGLKLNLIISLIIGIISKSITDAISFFIVFQLAIMVGYYFRLNRYVENAFYSLNKERAEVESITEFYNNYLIEIGKSNSSIIQYNEVSRCVETDTNFYLECQKNNKIVIIQKEKCNLELINFIKNKFKDLNNKLNNVKKNNSHYYIQKRMSILFQITILSLFVCMILITLIKDIFPQPIFDDNKFMWIFWCFLPIPILSIILGVKYKKEGYNCKKNIIVGIIIGFLLLVYGAFSIFPTYEDDYKKINLYKDIINVNIPSNGTLTIRDYGDAFGKKEYVVINAYYKNKNIEELVSNIENSNTWVSSEEFNFELRTFFPPLLKYDSDAYFSIYNKTTNEYNTFSIPEEKYEIYAMKYDISDKILSIHKFDYYYNK